MGRQEFDLVYDWLPQGARDALWEAYIETGDPDVMWEVVRNDSAYERWFPGNLDESGRPRYDEFTYGQAVAGYDDVFRSVGLNPELFRSRYGELIAGDVTPQELETYRVAPMYERVVNASEPIRQWYSENYGVDMTGEALLAAALDPEIGQRVLGKQISMAEIAGEGKESGFDVSYEFAERLLEAGMDRRKADELFVNAETFVPVLSVLASRHADPGDEFDLQDFVSADLFGDPKERARMRRLIAQERSTFTESAQTNYARSKAGGMTGLEVS